MENQGFVPTLAGMLNTPEPALRLLLSMLAGYPIALLYILFLAKKKPLVKHVFFTVTGIATGIFNFGWGILHCIGCIGVQHSFFRILGARKACVAVSFIFHMSYLLIGYYRTATDGYDINWTMPHCVLVLRLIGLAFDYYDGRKRSGALTEQQKKTALLDRPSLMEMCGHVFFPGGFLVGPQFPMKRYLDFTKGEFDENNCIVQGILRGLAGVMYLIVYQVGSQIIPDAYLVSEGFAGSSLLYRVFVVGAWAKICLYKYISCWLITEGVCIVTGLAYNGDGRWDGCANVKVRVFENATRFKHFIGSFNTNTNAWVSEYVYKRLRFLDSVMFSRAAALFFLAVWHGLHPGYYVTFFLEFVVIYFERQMQVLAVKNEMVGYLATDAGLAPVRWLVGKVYVTVLMGFGLVPFVLFNDYWTVYRSFYYCAFALLAGFFLVLYVITRQTKIQQRQKVKQESNLKAE